MKEREISLLELLAETMLHWRGILLWMLAGAVLAGAFSYVRSYRALEASNVEVQGQMSAQDEVQYKEELEEQLTDAQLQNVHTVLAYEAVYKEKLAYQENSILMQMDPNCIQRADLTFYVNADNWRRACSIEKAYEDMIQGGELTGYVAGQIHVENTGSVSDALSLARGAGSMTEGTDTFRISIIHFDKAVLQDMAEAVVVFFEKKHGQVEKIMGSHEIIVANESEEVITDMGILQKQKDALDDIASMKNTISQYKNAFTAEEEQYYNFISAIEDSSGANGEEEQEPGGASADVSPIISKKYVVFGMLLAAFLYVFVFFMRYVFDDKMHFSDNLQELYGIVQLGTIGRQQEGGKPFAFIDRWIFSVLDRGRRRFTKDEAMQLSVAAVKMAAVEAVFDWKQYLYDNFGYEVDESWMDGNTSVYVDQENETGEDPEWQEEETGGETGWQEEDTGADSEWQEEETEEIQDWETGDPGEDAENI